MIVINFTQTADGVGCVWPSCQFCSDSAMLTVNSNVVIRCLLVFCRSLNQMLKATSRLRRSTQIFLPLFNISVFKFFLMLSQLRPVKGQNDDLYIGGWTVVYLLQMWRLSHLAIPQVFVHHPPCHFPSAVLCVFGRPFVKRFALCYRTVVLSVCVSVCLSCLWPNGWMDQHETWHAGRPRPWPHCVIRGPSSSPAKGHTPNSWPISVLAKWLDGSRCHWVWRKDSAQVTLC